MHPIHLLRNRPFNFVFACVFVSPLFVGFLCFIYEKNMSPEPDQVFSYMNNGGRRGRDRMVVGFTTICVTYASVCTYHH